MIRIFDAGAFVALERNDRAMWRRLKSALIEKSPPQTHGGVVAQIWRGGTGRQVLLSRALQGIEITPLDEELGRKAGILLANSGLSDAIDSAVVALASDDDQIFTSDPDDIDSLVTSSGKRIDVISV